MAAWLSKQGQQEYDDPEEELDDFYDVEMSWRVFVFMEQTQGDDWQWLPKLYPGGLLSFPDTMMHDLMNWKRMKEIVSEMLKPAQAEQRGEE